MDIPDQRHVLRHINVLLFLFGGRSANERLLFPFWLSL